MADRTQVDTGDLWSSVDRLTQVTRHRIIRGPSGRKGHVEHHTVPSLWDQLVQAQASDSAGGDRGRAAPGSRAPLDLTITALLADMTRSVVDALVAAGGHPRYRTTALGVRLLDTPAGLRALATVVRDSGDQARVTLWTRRYWQWVQRAEKALALDEDSALRPAWGQTCPLCGTTYVTLEIDGDETRAAAIVAKLGEGLVVDVRCRSCTMVWPRGEGFADPEYFTEHGQQEADTA